ncbi:MULTISPECIES: biofilm development regulator YmgB/AriR family protein [unclassified Pantoea]|uniref:biofilm development regulator YmgB/AriR family protein n=1 Tax=unclassified Pantoea TaxID=2630326 RepID=UPI001CD5D03A|nr:MULTISPECIES: biofilm development regulator YmgB/AriR family protein [unclassified Pantoea]MCA1175067.1 hypothetical protein [Pantoea sp. alder69]MCA1250029.1 hypothetical protein [Pantoea sp. alder70]MCA1264016.1 hypothetical protein [Pantoea sp. alder81]
MQESTTAESRLLDYFQTTGEQYLSERVIISEIRLELLAKKHRITNKDIILALILRLECESDIIKQDIYRNALEIVVQRTPDDIS